MDKFIIESCPLQISFEIALKSGHTHVVTTVLYWEQVSALAVSVFKL